MEATAKPGAGLLWAFELHRENQVLSKRLKAIETTTAKQQEQITSNEQNADLAQQKRLDLLIKRLDKLEHSDLNAQIAGLTSQFQSTQRQLEQMQGKVKHIDKANGTAESKSEEKNRDIERRLEELTSALARTENVVHVFGNRLELATDHEVRSTVEILELSIERNEHQLKDLSGKVCNLQQTQVQLQVLLEDAGLNNRFDSTLPVPAQLNGVRETRKAADVLPSSSIPANDEHVRETSTTLSASGRKPRILHSPVVQRNNDTATTLTTKPGLPATKTGQEKPLRAAKRKRGFSKELTQLLHGDGSLTNATPIPQGNVDGPITRASKKPKIESVQGFPRESRSKMQKTQVNSALTKARAAAPTAAAAASSALKPASTATIAATAVHKAAKTGVSQRKGRNQNPKQRKQTVAKQPLLHSSSSEIQVAMHRFSPASKQHAAPMRSPLPPKPNDCNGKHEQQQPPRRRRIQQDDSMEEFLAKCQAAIES